MRANDRTRNRIRNFSIISGLAVLSLLVFGEWIPFGVGVAIIGAAFVGAGWMLFSHVWIAPGPSLRSRDEHVNTEFRAEVERYLQDATAGKPRPARRKERVSDKPSTPVVRPKTEDMLPNDGAPPVDLLSRIVENVEVLGGYRDDLSALVRLHRMLEDPQLPGEKAEATRREIDRFEKRIALPFLLEDSEAVQEETIGLVDDLRRWLRSDRQGEKDLEVWTPCDLHHRLETAIQALPEDRVRTCWFERHLGDITLVLTKPETLYKALYHVLDYFTEKIGGGSPIHIRTAQRGDYAWIGIGSAPSESARDLDTDVRMAEAGELWNELGAKFVTGDTEVRILLPLHGPMHIFQEEAGESAEKTG